MTIPIKSMDAEVQRRWDAWADGRIRRLAEKMDKAAMKAIIEATVIQLDKRDARLRAEFSAMLAAKDGAGLLKGGFGAVMQANLAAISQVCDAVELKRATLVDGEPSPSLRKALK